MKKAFDSEQWGVLRGSVFALLFAALVLGAGWVWLPPEIFGLSTAMDAGDRLSFALKADLFLFLWLAWAIRRVSSQRFYSVEDRKGSAYGKPTEVLAIRQAVLQNSLEQTALAFGTHLALATVLPGDDLVLIPLLVAIFIVGRIFFTLTYPQGAAQRSFGMALTAASPIAAILITFTLMILGR